MAGGGRGQAPGPKPATETERILAEALADSIVPYGEAEPGAPLARLRWAELAARLGVAFVPTLSAWSFGRRFPGHCWPRHLVGPLEGSLDAAGRDVLLSLLRPHTAVERVLFRFWFLATDDWPDDTLLEGALDEVRLFPDEARGLRGTPTHWFPEDRAWLVCSDHDLTFTLVGGSEALTRELLEHPELECVRVQPGTGVGWKADLEEED